MKQSSSYTLTTALVLGLFTLSGCATWSTSSVQQSTGQKQTQVAPTQVNDILVTDGDITNRSYESLGDITVTVNKTTIFNQDPTKADVDMALKEKAAKMGADAVIFARYGQGGISAFSWGSLEGKGRAIQFKD
ncbi:MAG: hypothetical protein AB7E85_08390 [Pseudobdellovibrionaceae bacterium]